MISRPWISTHSGKEFYLDKINPDSICLEDIAHALSLNCRYNGHIKHHYSVGAHSINVAIVLADIDRELIPQALLHDASEAYIADIVSPLKAMLPEYREVEDRVQRAIFSKYEVSYPIHDAVDYVDKAMIAEEVPFLFRDKPAYYNDLPRLEDIQKHLDIPQPPKNLGFVGLKEELSHSYIEGYLLGLLKGFLV